jgi:hypothetical protein
MCCSKVAIKDPFYEQVNSKQPSSFLPHAPKYVKLKTRQRGRLRQYSVDRADQQRGRLPGTRSSGLEKKRNVLRPPSFA